MADMKLGMVGYGEVGKIFTQGLKGKPGVISVSAWDLKFADATLRRQGRAHADQADIKHQPDMAALCADADLVISAVTASNTLSVAKEAAGSIRPGTFFLDLNSASPGTKQQAAAEIERAGAHYVEAGVMTSVPPYGIAVPMLLGGNKAQQLSEIMGDWGMNATVVAARIGVASAIKMCRSIMIKGLEALVIESYSTAWHYGVEDHVLPTLAETFPQIDWVAQGTYFFSRVVQHGKRRAEEMRESAQTVNEAGFLPLMASAIAQKQDWVADMARQGVFDKLAENAPWQEYADRITKYSKLKSLPDEPA
jgi:3-hydroxyisobutyrate dehydrogenase-like beta-hydroxyacid dehydrogenase